MIRRHKSRLCKGFTLIELLVVIGIIAVLVALAMTAFKGVEATAMRNKTAMLLSNAKSFMAEYDTQTGMKNQPAYMYSKDPAMPPPTKYTTADFDIWKDGDPSTVPPTVEPFNRYEPALAPRGHVADLVADDKAPQAVLNAAVVFKEILRASGAKNAFKSLPTESILTIKDSTKAVVGQTLVDGWGNPIIYVPASGLGDVAFSGDQPGKTRVITSAKTYVTGTTPPLAGELLPGARPFFASAGPDGVFGYIDADSSGTFTTGDIACGDDNIYSFEK